MKKLLIYCAICFTSISSKAQITSTDSIWLNSLFVEPLYINPNILAGTWFRHPAITSVNDVYQQINEEYPFSNNELLTAYNQIVFNGGVVLNNSVNGQINAYNQQFNTFLFGIHNPFVALPFQLNNKMAVATALRDSASFSNPTKAFVIFSGSGDNQLTRLTVSATNYHNTNCNVRQFLKNYGDVYVLGLANEDERAIHYNGKKLGRYFPAMPTHLQDTLNQLERAMGVNRLVESIAWIKYLKSQYNEVHLLGLSMGGTEALWTAILTQPNTALIASGYSVLFDTDSSFQTINGYFYSNYMNYFIKDSIRKFISERPTQFWFTRGINDRAIFTADSVGAFTETYLAGLNNCFFYSDFNDHTFPPCSWIGNMINQYTAPNQVDGVSKNTCNVYPNPFNDLITISSTNKIVELSVYDMMGRKLMTRRDVSHNHTLETSNWPTGTYYIQIATLSDCKRYLIIKK